MAEIYIAQQRGMEGFEKIVVIKTILPNLANNQEFVQMFLDEARLAARLTHPNIVQIYDLGRVGQTYFIAMEYVQGENLRQIARACRKQGKLVPLEHTVKIISQACEGLHHAHTKTDAAGNPLHIVHRDVSPQNILISFEGITKIVDFGIAKAATQYQETRAGVLKGKYSYMSPEQCSGQNIDARSDVFSLGIVLWELATGTRLYKRDSELQILKDITESPVPPPRQINSQLPAELEAIILKALEKQPAKRFQSALEMHLALEQFAKNRGLTSSTVHLAGFMRAMFAEKLDSLRKIEQAQVEGKRLESMLFDDLESSNLYYPGSTTPSKGTPAATPPSGATDGSQPLVPKPTTGVSRVQPQPAEQTAPKRTGFIVALAVMGLLVLGLGGWILWKLLQPEPTPITGPDAGVAEVTGRIQVKSNPAGVEVLLDGNRVGVTPCEATGLSLGRVYSLQLKQDGYRAWGTQFKLESAEPRSFDAVLERIAKPGVASVDIVSVPPGAAVTLDGKPVPGLTPLKISGVEAGKPHEIVVSMEGRISWSTRIEPSADENVSLAARLEPASVVRPPPGVRRAQLNLRSLPAGASFLLDGSPVSPGAEVEAGRHTLVARLDGYQEWSVNLRLRPGERKSVVANLRPLSSPSVDREPGLLSVDCKPWARVYVNGRQIGTTPVVDFSLAAGRYTLRLENDELESRKEITVVLKPGERVTKSLAFGQGYLKILVKPWAHVYLNGKKIGTTPFPPKPLFEGNYRVELKNPDLGRNEEKTIRIEEGKTAEISVDFLN